MLWGWVAMKQLAALFEKGKTLRPQGQVEPAFVSIPPSPRRIQDWSIKVTSSIAQYRNQITGNYHALCYWPMERSLFGNASLSPFSSCASFPAKRTRSIGLLLELHASFLSL